MRIFYFEVMKPYCLRCQCKVEMVEPIIRRHTYNRRYLYIGHCSRCGWKVSIIRQEENNETDNRK